MLKTRVIPCLLLRDKGLVKTIKFKDSRYIGDPINAVRIFSEKEVHELIFLDINASIKHRKIDIEMVQNIADECYMPFAVGGGITCIEDVDNILRNGAEKVVLNTSAVKNPLLIKEIAEKYGSQSIVVSIDAKKKLLSGYEVMIKGGKEKTSLKPEDHAKNVAKLGAGEIMINSIDNDGQMQGYDLNLIKQVSEAVNIPVIASGGAGIIQHLKEGVKNGASALAAGSMFVYHGARRAVLINFPSKEEIENAF